MCIWEGKYARTFTEEATKYIDVTQTGGESMLKYVIIVALIANAISFFIVAKLNKHVVNQGVWQTNFNETTTYLICGMMPRSADPFDWLLDESCPISGGVHAIFYQNFGFNPHVAAYQIGDDIYRRSRNAVFVTMSIGAEIPLLLGAQHQHIAIDPCLGRQSLKRFNGILSHVVAIILEVIVFVLGWLAFLPIIRSGENRFSLALLADWLYWGTADLKLEDQISLNGIITSSYDGIIDNNWLSQHIDVNEHCWRKIPCGHCDIRNFGSVYKADLSSILQYVTDFRIFSR